MNELSYWIEVDLPENTAIQGYQKYYISLHQPSPRLSLNRAAYNNRTNDVKCCPSETLLQMEEF